MEFTRLIRTTLLSMFMLYGEKSILVRVGDGCRVAGLAENKAKAEAETEFGNMKVLSLYEQT